MVFGPVEWARLRLLGRLACLLSTVRQRCQRFGEGELVREDNARIWSFPSTNLKWDECVVKRLASWFHGVRKFLD